MGDDVICILSCLVGLCAELAQELLAVCVRLMGCDGAEGSIAGHAPGINCLMCCGLSHSTVYGFELERF